MQRKILIAACLGALTLVLVVFCAARLTLARSFATIESDQARRGIERVNQSLQMELQHLQAAAEDNGQWDQAYEFSQGRRPGFASENFTRAGLDSLQVQLVWMSDAAGRTLVDLGTRDARPGELSPLSRRVLRQIQGKLSRLASSGESASREGLLRLPDGLLAFSAAPVLRGDKSGPPSGLLLYGRYLDAPLVERLAAISQSPVQLIPLDEQGLAQAPLTPPVTAWLSRARFPSDDLFLGVEAGGSLYSYALLRDIEGRPIGLMVNTMSRAALQVGESTIEWVVAVVLAGFTLAVCLLLTVLNRSWRARELAQRQWLDHQRKLSRLARRDILTGLPNRVYLQRLLPRLLRRAARDRSRLALLCLDLDHFKNVNDSLGHGSGDKLLTAIAHRLRTSVSSHDIVVRMGGDEFLVVATALPDADVVDSIADRIRGALVVPLEVDGVTMFISPSIGISVFPEDGSDPEQLLKHADIALYHAKDQGRGNHQFYTPELNVRLRERLGLERALRQALERQELSIEYQPCFDLQSLRPVSFEALLRWRTADGTWIPPSRFIPIAEQSGLIIEIGTWVLRRVCQQLAAWQRQHLPLLPVSVNLSVRQFEQAPLATVVAGLAQEWGIDSSLLHFEITESTAMQNSQQHLGALQALRNLGARILIDDFGTGYSSLSYLKHLPIDTLKIDRAFVRDMAVDANDSAIVRAIVGVAKSLGLQLVAEGIESAEQLECLRKLGCECGQGFFFSPPVAAQACESLLAQVRNPPRHGAEPPKLRLLTPVK